MAGRVSQSCPKFLLSIPHPLRWEGFDLQDNWQQDRSLERG